MRTLTARIVALAGGALVAMSACTGGSPAATPPPPAGSGSTPTPAVSGTTLRDGTPLPATCVPSRPLRTQTVTFVADGSAWALDPAGTGVPTCLFDVPAPGPFTWSPRGDRALLADLAIENIRGATVRTGDTPDAGSPSWGHPIGKAVVYISADGKHLEKVYPGSQHVDDITPVEDVTYLSVIYHPSGTALAFVVDTGKREEIWLSSNVGADPKLMVFAVNGTQFGAMDFSADGNLLYYGALHQDGSLILHDIDLRDPSTNTGLWRGESGKRMLGVFASPDPDSRAVAMTTGTSCEDSQAVVLDPDGTSMPVGYPGTPSRVVGWVDAGTVLIAEGGCGVPASIATASLGAAAGLPLVVGVDEAASRRPLSGFVPALPQGVEQIGAGVG